MCEIGACQVWFCEASQSSGLGEPGKSLGILTCHECSGSANFYGAECIMMHGKAFRLE